MLFKLLMPLSHRQLGGLRRAFIFLLVLLLLVLLLLVLLLLVLIPTLTMSFAHLSAPPDRFARRIGSV